MGDFDVFQKFPDGSSRWHQCISGRYNTRRRLNELAEICDSEFYAVDISSGEVLSSRTRRAGPSPAMRDKAPRRDVA
jgi:hypothetical protein